MNDVKGYLYSTEYQTRNNFYETIINKSLYYAKAKNDSIVKNFIDNLLDIIMNFESRNFKKEDVLLNNLNVNEIITNLTGSIDNMGENLKKEIHKMGTPAPEQSSKVNGNNSYWVNQNTGEKCDPNKIFQNGIIKAQFGSDKVRAEYTLPDGNTTYCEIDPESGSVMNIVYAYPLSEYKLDIPQNLIIRKEKCTTTNGEITYPAEIINLKWGKRVVLSYENGLLIDIDCNTRTHIDDTNKIIHIIDYSNELNII